eukprot:NODE_30_length_32972_cov_0.541052.p10 type:complete len:361 gc:universal NODE_30_length_32972_cov_0.541052:26136-27218(+)
MFLTLMSVYSVISDCADVINLARGLNFQMHDPDYFAAIQNNCCELVYCTETHVNIIEWDLSGMFTRINGTVNASAIPYYVERLSLAGNEIHGGIPQISSPFMQMLELSNNNFNGTLPSLPPNIQIYAVSQNNLHGDVPYLPPSLADFYLGFFPYEGWQYHTQNRFTGVVRLNAPIALNLIGNWITDVIIDDPSRLEKGLCDLSNNPLLNNPNVAKLTNCIMKDLYDSRLLSNTVIALSTTNELKAGTTDPLVQTKITTDNPVATFRKRLSNSATRDLQMSTTTAATNSVKTEKVSMPTAFRDVRSTIRLDFTSYSVTQYIFAVLKIVVDIALSYYTLLTAPFKREWENRNTSKVSTKSFL